MPFLQNANRLVREDCIVGAFYLSRSNVENYAAVIPSAKFGSEPLFLFFSNPIAPAVFCCLLSSPPSHPPLDTWHEPAIKSEVTSALCTALCDPAPAVRYIAVSAVQNLVTIAGLPIDDAPQLLPPLCMNRFHHADGVKTVAHVSGNSSTALFALYSHLLVTITAPDNFTTHS